MGLDDLLSTGWEKQPGLVNRIKCYLIRINGCKKGRLSVVEISPR